MRIGKLFPIERGGGGVEDAFRNEGAWFEKGDFLIPHYRDVAVCFPHSLT